MQKPNAAPLTLRGHHLLCTLNYSGSGYTEKFIENLDDVCQRLSAGEAVTLTWAADTICQPMLGEKTCHCFKKEIHWRDFWGFCMSSLVLRTWCFPPRQIILKARQVAQLRMAFATHAIRIGCVGCSWYNHCTATAKAGWLRSKLRPYA